MALALSVRDRLINQWLQTQRQHHDAGAKRVYYLSLEFLMGRALGNNIINLGKEAEDAFRDAITEMGYDLEELRDMEVDAGLGNGGLGYQVEHPDNWLRYGNPWEIERPEVSVNVRFGGRVQATEEKGKIVYKWIEAQPIIGVAYDMPILGYGGTTVTTLRLWSARADEEFNFTEFNEGDYVDAVSAKVDAENLTKCLYPNDKQYLGKELRLKQQYFFVACHLGQISEERQALH